MKLKREETMSTTDFDNFLRKNDLCSKTSYEERKELLSMVKKYNLRKTTAGKNKVLLQMCIEIMEKSTQNALNKMFIGNSISSLADTVYEECVVFFFMTTEYE